MEPAIPTCLSDARPMQSLLWFGGTWWEVSDLAQILMGAILGPVAGWGFMAVVGFRMILFSWHEFCWGDWAGRTVGTGTQSLSVNTNKSVCLGTSRKVSYSSDSNPASKEEHLSAGQ